MNIAVLVTASGKEEAEKIAQVVLTQKLAACVNIIPGVQSYFWWEGKIDSSPEVSMIIKTDEKKFNELAQAVRQAHSYDTPEIIALPIVAGDEKYMKWMNDALK